MKLTKIPRNLLQTWSTKHITENFQLLIQSWISHNPGYSYFMFDDNDCAEMIKNNFDENVYKAYLRIIPGAFKSHFWRYCVLYLYGGVYVDMDTLCTSSIDDLLEEQTEFMVPIDLHGKTSYNLSNGFIAAAPKHPILWECIQMIVHNVEKNIVPFSNLDFSGSGLLGKATNRFLGLPDETPFIGKEGIVRNIKFLKYEVGTEYVVDPFKKTKLFQNKNGNAVIQTIFNTVVVENEKIDWRLCSNPIKPTVNTTIVSMFYKIREKEHKMNRSIDQYLHLANEFILKLDYNLIVFTDSEDVVEFVSSSREKQSNLQIYFLPFEETYFYKDLDRLIELQQLYTIYNGHLQHETPMYIILNNDKFDFMQRAIEQNPFNSTHFVWMDFGINHVALNTERIHDWIHCIPDKIKQMCINPYIENVEHKQMFQNIYHHMAGGLFSGSKENMLKYCALFKQKTEQIYSEDWYQIDEAVMTIVARENPDLFTLYYGDYQGIVSNYLYPIHNLDLIFQGITKCLNNNNTKIAWEILNFCGTFFRKHLTDRHIYDYVRFKLITDYYHNNRCFSSDLISIVKELKENNNPEIQNVLVCNMPNINYYENKNEIL